MELPVPLPRRLVVKVRPSAPKTMLTSWDGSVLHVDVAAPPEDNKANIALLKFLKRLTKKQVVLVSGATSREKVVEFV